MAKEPAPAAKKPVFASAPVRARSSGWGRQRSVEEVKRLRASLKLDANQAELQHLEDVAKAEANAATPDADNSPLPLAGAPVPPAIPVPPGHDRDLELERRRQN